jgi:GNAT superfamily N-acetyltransferase
VEDFEDAGGGRATPPLLIRHAAVAAAQQAAALLRDVPLDPGEVAELLGQRGVLVLSDVTLPPTAPPVGAVAFRVDRRSRTAELAGVGMLEPWRGQELGQRLVTGALTAARADGVERVVAWARPGSPWASLLAVAGFVADNCTADSGGRRRYLLLL